MPPELGKPNPARAMVNDLHRLVVGGQEWQEPLRLIEEIISNLEKKGWPDSVPPTKREKYLEAVLHILPRPQDGETIDLSDQLLIRTFRLLGHPAPVEQSAA